MKFKKQKEIMNNEIKKKSMERLPQNTPDPVVRKISTKQLMINLLIKISVIAIVVFVAFQYVIGIRIHYGNNMHPAIKDGDLVVSLKMQRPYLNAVVLYNHNGEKHVGRIVGLPGNEIDITDKGELFTNGVLASGEIYYPTYKANNSTIKYPYTVEEGKAFILNDFREKTDDSRLFGTIDLDDIDGPLIFTLRRRGF